jgi:hypothetical protein
MVISQGNSLCSYVYLKQTKVSFFFSFFSSAKLKNRRQNGSCPREGWPVGGGKWQGKGVGD